MTSLRLLYSIMLGFLLCAGALKASAQPVPKILTSVTLTGPNSSTTQALGTSTSVVYEVSASVPKGEIGFDVPSVGFKFLWPRESDIIRQKFNAVIGQWEKSVADNSVTLSVPGGWSPVIPCNDNDTGRMQATLMTTFPEPGQYRIQMGVVGSWWGGDQDHYEGNSKTLTTTINVIPAEKLR